MIQSRESRESSKVLKERGFQSIEKAVNQSIAIVKQAKKGERDVLKTMWPRLNKNLL